MALVALSALPSSTVVATSDISPFVIGGTTKKMTAGAFRTALFAFAATDPLNIGSLTAVGPSTITGALSGITTLTAATGVFTSLTVPTAAQPNITSTGSLTCPTLIVGPTTGNSCDVSSGAANTTTFMTVSILNSTKQALFGFDSTAGAILGSLTNHIVSFRANNTEWLRLGVTGTLTMLAAVSRLVPGATSFSIRNAADAADNFTLTNAGVATIAAGLTLTSGPLTFGQASQKIALPSGSFVDFRTAADASSALLVRDTGGVQLSSGQLTLAIGTTAYASLSMGAGTAPTSPIDGQMWYDGTNVKFRVGVATKTFTLT